MLNNSQFQSHPKLRYFSDFVIKKDPKEDYRLLKNIGSGTYGEVYKATQKSSGMLAAVKIVKIDIKDDVKAIAQEIHTLRECRHPNIVEYYGSYLRRNKLWICMEFCGGFSMQDIYTNIRRSLDESCIAFVTRETLRGLAYMHKQGKIHRDIKGANILLTEDGQVKIADFGVAAQITQTIQKRNSFIGTPYWMAPEVAAVERKGGYDEKCDIWAVGITAIEYAELQPPMFDLHPMKALHILSMRNYKAPVLQMKQKWNSKFHGFLKTCLNKNEKRRPDADQMLKHEFLTAAGLSVIQTRNLMQFNKNPGKVPLVPNDDDEDDEDARGDNKQQAAEKIKSTRRSSKHTCIEDIRFRIPDISDAPICEAEELLPTPTPDHSTFILQDAENSKTESCDSHRSNSGCEGSSRHPHGRPHSSNSGSASTNSSCSNRDQRANPHSHLMPISDEYLNHSSPCTVIPISPLSVRNKLAEIFSAYNDVGGEDKASDVSEGSHNSAEEGSPPTPPPKRSSQPPPVPPPPSTRNFIRLLENHPVAPVRKHVRDNYHGSPSSQRMANQKQHIASGLANKRRNSSVDLTDSNHTVTSSSSPPVSEPPARRFSQMDAAYLGDLVMSQSATASTDLLAQSDSVYVGVSTVGHRPVPPLPRQINGQTPLLSPPLPGNKPRSTSSPHKPQSRKSVPALSAVSIPTATISSGDSTSSSKHSSDDQNTPIPTTSTSSHKVVCPDNEASGTNLVDIGRRRAAGVGLPPTPRVQMGACFSLIFGGCPLKVNATATWIHPITNAQIILFGTNEGIYYISLDELAEGSMSLLFPRRCVWLYVVHNTMMSVSGQHPQLYNHNLVLMFKLKSHGGASGSGSSSGGGVLQTGISYDKSRLAKLLPRRFIPTTKVPDTKGCQMVSVTRNPYSGAKYLCAALQSQVLVMEWFPPISTFMEVRRVNTASLPRPLLNFDLIVFPDTPLPLACVGVYSEQTSSSRPQYRFHLIDLNLNSTSTGSSPPDDGLADTFLPANQHPSVESLPPPGEPQVVSKIVQLEFKTILIALQEGVVITNLKGQPKSSRTKPYELKFSHGVESIVCLNDSILAFHHHGFCGKNFNDQLTQEINDKTSIYRLIGCDKNIVVEKRSVDDPMNDSNIYILAGHTDTTTTTAAGS